jgi:hypothetical protein
MSTTKEQEFYSFVPPAGVGTGLPNAPIVFTNATAPALIVPVGLTITDSGLWVAVTTVATGMTIRFGSSVAMGSAVITDAPVPPNVLMRFRVGYGTQFASTFGTGVVFFWKANP